MSAPEGWFVASIAADLQSIPDYNTSVGSGIAGSQKIPTPLIVLNQGGFFDAATSIWTPPAGLVVMGSYAVWELESGATVPEGAYMSSKVRKNGSIFLPGPNGGAADDGELDRILPPTSAAAASISGEIMDVANGTDFYEWFGAFFVAAGALHRLQATGFRTRFWGIAFGA